MLKYKSCTKIPIFSCGRVAQLDRASACGAEGRRFDSCRDHQKGWDFFMA